MVVDHVITFGLAATITPILSVTTRKTVHDYVSMFQWIVCLCRNLKTCCCSWTKKGFNINLTQPI